MVFVVSFFLKTFFGRSEGNRFIQGLAIVIPYYDAHVYPIIIQWGQGHGEIRRV